MVLQFQDTKLVNKKLVTFLYTSNELVEFEIKKIYYHLH